jgi:glycogen debranching enzyme
MDAKIGDHVVTPRIGKPVEIQALWYNALKILGDFAHEFGDSAAEPFFRELAARARESFTSQFWNTDAGCLFDVIDGENRDASIRPNQIFAVSLYHRMLSSYQEAQVVGVVERELLTPFGLRTLSPRDANYHPHYEGGVRERDSAYHQGTVWPWLVGPFLSAYIKVHGRSAESKQQAELWLQPFRDYLNGAGLGQIPEIVDAEPPFTPRGCIAQAWSIAEILRAAVEDVFTISAGKTTQTAVATK